MPLAVTFNATETDEVTGREFEHFKQKVHKFMSDTQHAIDEAVADVAALTSQVAANKAQLEALEAKIAAFPTEGLTADQLAALHGLDAGVKAATSQLASDDNAAAAVLNPATPVAPEQSAG